MILKALRGSGAADGAPGQSALLYRNDNGMLADVASELGLAEERSTRTSAWVAALAMVVSAIRRPEELELRARTTQSH